MRTCRGSYSFLVADWPFLLAQGRCWRRRPRADTLAPCVVASTVLVIVGLVVLLLSAAPLPLWFYGITVVLVIAWLILFRFRGTTSLAKKRWAGAIVAGVLLVGEAFELRYQFAPQVAPVTARRIYLFGDSLAAGINDHRENNWPQIVARSHNVEVVNYARPGAKTATALWLAQDASLMGGIVLIEIGGNDVLGSTTAEELTPSPRRSPGFRGQIGKSSCSNCHSRLCTTRTGRSSGSWHRVTAYC